MWCFTVFVIPKPDLLSQTKPEVALERVRARSRGEEHLISEDYIQQLHNLHEDWLIGHKFPVPAPVVG